MQGLNSLKKIFSNLESSVQNVRELIFSFSGPVLLLSCDFRILEVNQPTNDIFGWKRQQVLRSNFYDTLRFYGVDFPDPPPANCVFPHDIVFSGYETCIEENGGSEAVYSWHMLKMPGFCDLDYKFLIVGDRKLHDGVDHSPDLNSYFSSFILGELDRATNLGPDIDLYKNTLQEIVFSLPGAAHIKSSSDFSYIAANMGTLSLLGLTSRDELIGKSDYDLAKLMGDRWPPNYASELRELDKNVLKSGKKVINQEGKPYLNAQGKLVSNVITKIPLIGPDNNHFGLLTFAIDMVHLKGIEELRKVYRSVYSNSYQGHLKFLEHINLSPNDSNAYGTLTERELDCLIWLSKSKTLKEAARELKLSPRTVETYVERIKTKLNCQSKAQAIELFLTGCK